jgi:hypothetical protein
MLTRLDTGEREDPRADDDPDAEAGQVPRAEAAPQGLPVSGVHLLGQDVLDRLRPEDGHARTLGSGPCRRRAA